MTKKLPVIPEEVMTSCLGATMIIRYNEMLPFGLVGEYHVALTDVAVMATKLSGLIPDGAI